MAAETTFDAIQDTLENLIREIGSGKVQLPDFQRGWVWDDQHIKSLLASVSRSFPVGAIMTLRAGGEVRFKPRPIEGVTFAGDPPPPERLILDGQQRLTSLYQALALQQPIRTRDDRRKEIDVWYYVDMERALGKPQDREEAIISIPADKMVKSAFGRKVTLDLSSPENEYKSGAFPINQIMNSDQWMMRWFEYWSNDKNYIKLFHDFKNTFIKAFLSYSIPIIELRQNASKEAVCLVFEKVNTGGVSLTAFELLTATFAADGYNLREDWFGEPKHRNMPGRAKRMAAGRRLLEAVQNTDFLQAVTLLHTYQGRLEALSSPLTKSGDADSLSGEP